MGAGQNTRPARCCPDAGQAGTGALPGRARCGRAGRLV